MINFLKNALRELQHVVWPTKNEMKKYFLTVLTVLVLFGLYLFIVNSAFSNILFTLKNTVSPSSTSVQNNLPDFDVSSVKTQTGVISNSGFITSNTGVKEGTGLSNQIKTSTQTGSNLDKKVK